MDNNKSDVDDFLNKISQIESSGGTNFNHKPITSGPQKGQTAIGTYGLLPNTVDEVVNRSKDPELKELKTMSPAEQKDYLESNPDKEQLVAKHLAEHVLSKQGGDQEKAAYSWLNGHNLSPDVIDDRDYQNSDYVKKFNKISDTINPTTSKKSIQSNFPGDKGAPLDIGGTPEGDEIQGYLNNLSSKDMMQQHYSQNRDNLKKAISLASSNSSPVMHSEFSNQDDATPDDNQPAPSLNFGDQPNNPSLLDNAKQAMNLYDTQVANRPRAAAMAALKGQNPFKAAMDNPPTSGEDIAKEGFKTLNPELTQTTNPSNVLMKQGEALAPVAPAAGMAVSAALDPMTYASGAIGAIKRVAPAVESLPLAERASASFLQKAGPSAKNYSNKLEKLTDMMNDANKARTEANQLWRDVPNSSEAKIANAKAFKAETDLDKYKTMYGKGYAHGGVVQPGFGDVKQSDRDLDSLVRQLDVAKDAKEQYPNITNAFGGDAEKIYRSKGENYPDDKYGTVPRRMPDEYAYGNIFKKAKSDLSGQSPNYLPSPYKAPDIEADAFNKDYTRSLRQSPESTPQDYSDLRHGAQDIAANAYDKDFLKSENFQDYLKKLKDDENVYSDITMHPYLKETSNAAGDFTPSTNSIRLSDESKGTAMHEIGHAKLEKGPEMVDSANENGFKYMPQLGRNADILRNYLQQLKLRGEEPAADNLEERKQLMNRAIDEGRGQLIADAGSGDHHAGYTLYPVDKTLDEYKNRLDEQGFERKTPESNPSFERVRSLINTIRNLNNK